MKINTYKLHQLLGSEEAVQRFVVLFREQLPVYLESLRKALAQKDWETASLSAHALKSQCRYMGLEEVAIYLERIEENPEQATDTALLDQLSAI